MIFLKILFILACGWVLGWLYSRIQVRQLNRRIRELQKSREPELTLLNGKIEVRYEEWPMDAEEYWNHMANESFAGRLDVQQCELEILHHLNVFASHMCTRQKRDFVKILKQLKGGDEAIKKLGWRN